MRSRALFLVGSIALAVASSPAAQAAPDSSSTSIPGPNNAKYKAGLQAEKAQDYEGALKLYLEIPVVERTVWVRLHIGDCLVRLGRFREAEELLTALVKDPAASAVRETAQSDLDDVRARIPKLSIRVATGSPPDLWVTIDGVHVAPPASVPLDPGTHQVSAMRGGKEVFRQKVTLQDSQVMEVEIDTSLMPAEPATANVSVPPMAGSTANKSPKDEGHDAGEPRSALRLAAPFCVTGLVFAGGAVASYVIMRSAKTSVEADCRNQLVVDCDTSAAGGGKVRTWETLAWVAGGLSVVSVGVGVTLLVTTPTAKEAPKSSAAVAPVVAPGFAGVRFEGRF